MTDKKVFKGSVRMSKASTKDMDAGYYLMNVLDDLDRGYYPELHDERDKDAPTFFDEHDLEHLQHLRGLLSKILDKSPGFMGRIMGGMSCFLNPKNAVIDPQADTIEFHPGLIRNAMWTDFDAPSMEDGEWWVWSGEGDPVRYEWIGDGWFLPHGPDDGAVRRPACVTALRVFPFIGRPMPPSAS